jgi:hypothetical protein
MGEAARLGRAAVAELWRAKGGWESGLVPGGPARSRKLYQNFTKTLPFSLPRADLRAVEPPSPSYGVPRGEGWESGLVRFCPFWSRAGLGRSRAQHETLPKLYQNFTIFFTSAGNWSGDWTLDKDRDEDFDKVSDKVLDKGSKRMVMGACTPKRVLQCYMACKHWSKLVFWVLQMGATG